MEVALRSSFQECAARPSAVVRTMVRVSFTEPRSKALHVPHPIWAAEGYGEVSTWFNFEGNLWRERCRNYRHTT